MPRPPKGIVTIPTRVNAPRWQSESSEGEDLFNEDFNIRDFEEDEEDEENNDCWTEWDERNGRLVEEKREKFVIQSDF